MKKVFLILASYLFTIPMFAQFEVTSNGFATSNNITVNGVMGVGESYGVITVKSNRQHPSYNPSLDPYGRTLIRTDCGTMGSILPFTNMYRGNINFFVMANGQIGTATGVLQSSAVQTLSRSAAPIMSSPLKKLNELNGVVYNNPLPTSDTEVQTASVFSDDRNNAVVLDNEAQAVINQQIEEEQSFNRFGLLAQEVEKVFPEVVRTLPDGTKGILYTDLIPVLIEGMKELQDSLTMKIASLQSQLDAISNPQPQLPGEGKQYSNGQLGQGQAELYQNTPNPFNQETQISYRLSANATTASICIYNLSGQQLEKHPLSVGTQNGTITVSASEYLPGMYIYALVINNQVIDSKRMTLTD